MTKRIVNEKENKLNDYNKYDMTKTAQAEWVYSSQPPLSAPNHLRPRRHRH